MKPPETEPPPPFDRSSTGGVVASIAARRFQPGPQGPQEDAEIVQALDHETSQQARAMLECQRSVTTKDVQEATERLLLALRADPKDIDPRCYAWHRLAFRSPDTAFAAAYAAWAPWDPLAWDRLGNLEGGASVLADARRSYLVAPRGLWANALGDALLDFGLRVEAKSVVAHASAPHLRVRLLAAEARFLAARDRATEVLAELPASIDASPDAMFVARAASEVDLVLEQPLSFVDGIVARYLDPEPPIMSMQTDTFLALLGACTVAPTPVAKRCLARLSSLYARGVFGVVYGMVDVALAGAVRYAAGDLAGAAAAWRPLVRAQGDVLLVLRHPVATALDRAGLADLADKVDAPMLAHAGPLDGADLAYVRAARRAAKRGDKARAKELAQKVVDAWSVADVAVPAVDEMKRLLARP
jgi:hypothetical protein